MSGLHRDKKAFSQIWVLEYSIGLCTKGEADPLLRPLMPPEQGCHPQHGARGAGINNANASLE